MSETEINALRRSCHTFLSRHQQLDPAEEFAAMAIWCAENQIQHDEYGEGELIQNFEKKVADLLGFPAALFCITGTMTQALALRVACSDRGSSLVALHPTAHIIKHERSNYQLLQHFQTMQMGDVHRPWRLTDLQAIPDRLGAASYELPMREIGGQLPSWEELTAIKTYCHERNIHLHMDGARLWEAQAGFSRSLTEIAQGFDSVYVSFYKGIGGLGGAMLLGSSDFIARVKPWMHRQGGNLYRRSPYVVAAAMQFDLRLAAMPAYFARTQSLYAILKNYPLLKVNPAAPQANMLHLHLPCSQARAIAIRNQIAKEHGIWLFGQAAHASLPDHSYVEWYVGDQLLNLSDERVIAALDVFYAELTR